jgi:hypothetical protein
MVDCEDSTCQFNRHGFAVNVCSFEPSINSKHECMSYLKKNIQPISMTQGTVNCPDGSSWKPVKKSTK